MIARLTLLRHAKAVPASYTVDDIDRPLNERGRQDAFTLGRAMRQAGLMPDMVMCSIARRTQETLEYLQEGHGAFTAAVTFVDELYHASADTILAHTKRTDVPHAMIIGHNPGMAELAARLQRVPLMAYPTCTLSSFDMQCTPELTLLLHPDMVTADGAMLMA